MDDTPSNYDIANQRFDVRNPNKRSSRAVKQYDGSNSVIEEESSRIRKKKIKRKKKVVQEYSEPSEKDIQMAKAYGGVARGAPKRQIPKGMQARGISSPMSNASR